ncbi:hypothetical protein BJ322DRAFT_980849, partial [Thelephora terrestris]
IFWLKGPHLTGKSAIARNLLEEMSEDMSLRATFFCSQFYNHRRNVSSIPPTLSFQLVRKYPEFNSALGLQEENIYRVIQEEDTCLVIQENNTSLECQVNDLIIKPLKKSAISTMIVIDGLDAC